MAGLLSRIGKHTQNDCGDIQSREREGGEGGIFMNRSVPKIYSECHAAHPPINRWLRDKRINLPSEGVFPQRDPFWAKRWQRTDCVNCGWERGIKGIAC